MEIKKSVILPLVFYGRDTLYLTLGKRICGVFDNRMLKVLGLKVEELAADSKQTASVELHGLYSAPNITRVSKSWRMRWTGHVAIIGERNAPYRISVGKPPGGRSLVRPRLTWEDNIKVVVKAIEWDGVKWINLVQYGGRCWKFLDTLINLQFQ